MTDQIIDAAQDGTRTEEVVDAAQDGTRTAEIVDVEQDSPRASEDVDTTQDKKRSAEIIAVFAVGCGLIIGKFYSILALACDNCVVTIIPVINIGIITGAAVN